MSAIGRGVGGTGPADAAAGAAGAAEAGVAGAAEAPSAAAAIPAGWPGIDRGGRWTSPGLAPKDFLAAVAAGDKRVSAPPRTGRTPEPPGLVYGKLGDLAERYDAAPAGRKPKLSELSTEGVKVLERERLARARDPFVRLDVEYTLALHAVASDAAAAGGTPAARAAGEPLRKLLTCSSLDWSVSTKDREKAAKELDKLGPREFFFALGQLKAKDVNLNWLCEPTSPHADLLDRKAAGLARAEGISGPPARALGSYLSNLYFVE